MVLRRQSLRGLGQSSAAYYGADVWLVGSALKDGNAKPRDWDIRIVLSELAFTRRFGDPKTWQEEGITGRWTDVRWRWSNECIKQGLWASGYTGLNVDFQIFPDSAAKIYKVRPKFRLNATRGWGGEG